MLDQSDSYRGDRKPFIKFEDEEHFLWLTEKKLGRLTEHETLSKASALLRANPIAGTPNVTNTDRILTLLGRILQRDN